jgi:hypothetical protein
MMAALVVVVKWSCCWLVGWWCEPGFLAVAVAVSVDDEFERCGREPVDCGLGEELVGEEGEPFGGVPV